MLYAVALLAALASCAAENWAEDYTQYVKPLLGSVGSGNMFPGAVRPVGMVKLGIDMDGDDDAYSGYLPEGVVWGFSMTHNSGTGGAPKYGVVSQMPWVGNLTNPVANLTSNRTEPDQAAVGYYRTALDSNVTVELAASDRAGMYRYTFNDAEEVANVVVDVSHVLPSYRGFGWSQHYTRGGIEVFDDGHYELNGTYDGGWNIAPNWTIYACGMFDQQHDSKLVFEGEGGNTTMPGNLTSYGESSSAFGQQRVGVVYTFPAGSTITSRVGISYISSAKACENVYHELQSDVDFDDLVEGTQEVWNKEVLSKITLPNGTQEDKELLYSMMYGGFLIPTNKTGENPDWESDEPYYEDTFTFWDTHRCATAMWQVLVPRIYEEYLRGLIDTFRYEGWISDARSSFWNGKVQGGSNSDNVLADAYVKGVRGQVDWETAYASMVKNAEVVPPNNFDPMANDSSTAEGRGALPDYLEYDYITPNYSRSVSRAIEYSVNDFCVSQVAYGLGRKDDGDKYIERSRNWRNHWNPNVESQGFKGFVVPRYANGSFAEQDPLTCGGCYWMDEYYQAPPWEYSWAATHDTARVVELSGGAETFVDRLNVMFEPGVNPDGFERFNYTLHNPGNQPGYPVPYLYNYGGRQDLSVQRSRYIAKTYYNSSAAGIPGNSDANVVVDVSHVLPSYRGFGWSQHYTRGGIEVFDDGHYELNGTYDGGWNIAPNWTIYACGMFDQQHDSKLVFEGEGGNTTMPGNLTSYGESSSAFGQQRVGVVYTFPAGSTITSRVGISYISSAKACENVYHELQSDVDFDDLVEGTQEVWNKEVLSKITLPNGTQEDKELLYSMMYGGFLIPTNKTGENPDWESDEPYYEDTFTFWDTHRCATAMWQVLVPRIYEEYLRGLIDTFRYEGWISDARSSFWNGKVQGGSNSDNVLADAYVKGVRGQVDWETAYASMVKNAEVVPPNNFDPMANDSSTAEGRGALPDYLEYDYITPNYSRSVSRAIEYSVNDFCVSQVAYGLGRKDDGDKYIERSRNWRNHWNPNVESQGFKGFVVPRYANGSFAEQDPLTCGGCYWMDEYYQAPPWEYSWAATHDTARVVELSGGAETFVDRLNVMFEPGVNPDGFERFNYTLHNPGNQPGYPVPYLYNYGGRQDLSVQRSRYIAKTYYNSSAAGIPGNSDAGAMQTWWLWNFIGLYPVTGRNVFLIHSPWQSCTIDLEQGKKLEIVVEGGNSDDEYYVQSLKINGQEWRNNWLTWDDVFAYGATMEFRLGAEPSDWFESGELPPSLPW